MLYFLSDPAFLAHDTGRGHPEQPARISVIVDTLTKAGLKHADNSIAPRLADDDEILLCHTPAYLELVEEEVSACIANHQLNFLSTGDVVISPNSLHAAKLAVGALLTAVDLIFTTPNSTAFCIVRPPGHHACTSRGMGFCLFNNIAIAARYAQQKYKCKKVLIVDWDVHHGNGTQEIFYSDPSVFYFSTHEKNLYPFTGIEEERGEGAGLGTNLNIPIDAGNSSRTKVIEAFDIRLREEMKTFKPDLILISAGFDSHHQDPLGHFNLTDEDFALLTQVMKEIANEYADGRLISVLEGGYSLTALASAAVAHATALESH